MGRLVVGKVLEVALFRPRSENSGEKGGKAKRCRRNEAKNHRGPFEVRHWYPFWLAETMLHFGVARVGAKPLVALRLLIAGGVAALERHW